MFSFKNVSVTYENSITTLKNFNLEIEKGEIIALVGESGAGKTTVIRAAIGLMQQNAYISEGDIFFNGKSLINLSDKEWKNIRGKNVSMIFQDCGSMLNPVRTIGSQFIEYIRTHSKMSRKEAYDFACKAITKTGLANSKNIMSSYGHQLSGGMRQRVGIAFAMAFEPEILFADEPTSALDVTTQAQIVKEMMELRNKFSTSIVVVTHNLGVATYMADKIVVLRQGEIVEVGTPKEIVTNPQSLYTQKLLDSVPDLRGKRYV